MGHARYIGRVGGLAVALGVGVAVATTPGVAWADEGSAGSDASASTSTADTTSGATAGGTTTGSLTGAAGGSSADPSADGGDDSADAGESAESGASTGGMQVDASGGAITSTTPGSAGAAADEDVDADADGTDTTVEGPAVEGAGINEQVRFGFHFVFVDSEKAEAIIVDHRDGLRWRRRRRVDGAARRCVRRCGGAADRFDCGWGAG